MKKTLMLAALLLALPLAGRATPLCQPSGFSGGGLGSWPPPYCSPFPPPPCHRPVYPVTAYNRFGYCAAGFTREGHYWSQAPRLLGRVPFQEIGDPALWLPPCPPPPGSGPHVRRF